MSATTAPLPDVIHDEAELDDVLTRPSAALVEFFRSLRGRLLVLGAGGKMGPTMAVLARRAANAAGTSLEVLAVSRFGDTASRRWLEDRGVGTLSADLLDTAAVAKLPDADNVVSLVGLKFGTAQDSARTWAVNTLVPANVGERYGRSRLVALSTGNVYAFTPVTRGGSLETDALSPLGEYPNSAVARERLYEYRAQQQRTPLSLIRLNYAVELRYGVLIDIACKVWAGASLDVTMGHLNCIWQGDANDMILRALGVASVPACAINLTGPILSVRELATRLGQLLGKPAQIMGTEADTALVSNTTRMQELLGTPPTPLDAVLRWTAAWVREGGRLLNKPTHFEVRDGKY